jgi:RNA polymerase sigma factor (sigma-70 family)
MDYDEGEKDGRRGLDAGDPLPPDDWVGFGSMARAEALYAAQRRQVAGIFRRSVPPQEVGDLVQETFRRVFSAKGHGAGLLDAPAAYVAAAARSILKNRARSGVRNLHGAHHSYEEENIAGPDPHAALEARDLIRRAEDVVARLSPTTRDVFLMHRLEDLSYQEIARIKGMKVKRVGKHIAKALAAVRQARDTHS